ncbi:MAG: hypothetical protein JST54_12480 [Deltaproteobacteria bacterium]|nr:hypothetical protein [Deltaproteobacteria bacterium]
MTLDQAIHIAMALGTLLIALVGFLAREQFGDVKKAIEKQGEKVDKLHELLGDHGERLASLEAQVDVPRASAPHPMNGRGRG